MKKYLPILLMALLAFAGCQPKVATYNQSTGGQSLITNAETFVTGVTKGAPRYSAENWNVILDEFAKMCEDYQANKDNLLENEQDDFVKTLIKFISATDLAKDSELPLRAKQVYRQICE